MRLHNKVAIVTGGGGGIGRAIAFAYAQEGAHVVIVDLGIDEAGKVMNEEVEMGGRGLAICCDVTKKEDVNRMAHRVVEEFGAIDILVNSAGIAIRSSVVDMKVEDWDSTMAVNLRGPFLCAQAVLPYMMKQRSGKIINISSDSGKKGWATGSAYCASKFGVIGLTEALAKEVADDYGIHVNAICPGLVDTQMAREAMAEAGFAVDWSKVTQPEEIARVAVFLASDESSAVFGASIDVYGSPSVLS